MKTVLNIPQKDFSKLEELQSKTCYQGKNLISVPKTYIAICSDSLVCPFIIIHANAIKTLSIGYPNKNFTKLYNDKTAALWIEFQRLSVYDYGSFTHLILWKSNTRVKYGGIHVDMKNKSFSKPAGFQNDKSRSLLLISAIPSPTIKIFHLKPCMKIFYVFPSLTISPQIHNVVISFTF